MKNLTMGRKGSPGKPGLPFFRGTTASIRSKKRKDQYKETDALDSRRKSDKKAILHGMTPWILEGRLRLSEQTDGRFGVKRMIKELAFPRMHEEETEKRDFLPSLFRKLGRLADARIYLEEGYGEKLGIPAEEYLKAHPNLSFVPHEEIFYKDVVIVVRVPKNEMLRRMKEGAVLISMLHYNTRPHLLKLLKEQGITCFSMDDIVDDWHNRIFVNYPGTSGSAVRVAFEELRNRMPGFTSRERPPIKATVLGLGKVAQAAAKAFEICSDSSFGTSGVPGVVVQMLPQSVTCRIDLLENLLSDSDMLVDCTKRGDPSEIIVPNWLLCSLPEHAVILDITSDPYDGTTSPPRKKAIEGVAYGTLDKFLLETDDPYYETLESLVDTTCRRPVVSCNAWPAFEPEACMKIYEEQLLPLLRVLFEKDPEKVSITSDDMYERALARSTLDYFLRN